MSNFWITSDTHLFHKNVYKVRNFVESSEHNTELFLRDYNSVVRKDDVVLFTGDVAFEQAGLDVISILPARKILVKGNHDELPLKEYCKVFNEIYGVYFKHGFQYSHVPVHTNSLRNRINIHGHLHDDIVRKPKTIFNKIFKTEADIDDNYFNCCPENLNELYNIGLLKRNSYLISLTELRQCLLTLHLQDLEKYK